MASCSSENFGDAKADISSEEALQRWRRAKGLLRNRKRRYRFMADLSQGFEAEAIRRANQLSLQKKLRIIVLASKAGLAFMKGLESNLDEQTQPLLDPNETQISCDTDDKEDRNTADAEARNHDGGGTQQDGIADGNNDNIHDHESFEIERLDTVRDRETRSENNDRGYIEVLEWIFLIFNFMVEVPALVFDQLSTVHKPQYAKDAMLISIAAFIMCMLEFAYKAWKSCRLRRSSDPESGSQGSESNELLAAFIDIIGPICASGQLIVTIINYYLIRNYHVDPVKISVWPVLFAFGLLCHKLLGQICGTNLQL